MYKDPSQQAYCQTVGTQSTNYSVIAERDPTANDVFYAIGKFWINTADIKLWYLNSQSNATGILQSNWQLLSVSTALISLSDTANTVVLPSGDVDVPPDNIQLVGGAGITVVSDPGNHLLTITNTDAGQAVETITGNDGIAETPSSNNFNFLTNNTTVRFLGSAATETLNFGLTNLFFGNSGGTITTGSSNLEIGTGTLNSVTSGVGNVALGYNAANSITTGSDNVAIGFQALRNATNPSFSTAVGFNALAGSTASTLTAVGFESMDAGVSGTNSTAVGASSLTALTSGSGNTAVGTFAMAGATTSNNSTAVGYNCMLANTGSNNTCIGMNTGGVFAPSSGSENSFVGSDVGDLMTTASSNAGIGYRTLSQMTTASFNSTCGRESLAELLTGTNNIGVGYQAGVSYNGSESSNICVGNAGTNAESNTTRIGTAGSGTGQQNRAFVAGITGVTVASSSPVAVNSSGQLSDLGFGTSGQLLTSNGAATSPTWQTGAFGATITGNTGGARSPTAGNWNLVTSNATVLIEGSGSTLTLNFNPATTNFCLGSSLPSLAGGVGNITLGNNGPGSLITSGSNNVIIGSLTGDAITTGSNNVCMGSSALSAISTGSNCVAIGTSALAAFTNTTATGCVAIGSNALSSLGTGAANVAIGNSAGSAYTTTETNNICINNNGTVGDSNTTRIGNTQTSLFLAGISGSPGLANSAPIMRTTAGQISSIGQGTTGQVITSNGAGVTPTWQAPVTSNTGNSFIASGSAVSLTTATNANVTSFSLAAGTWIVNAIVQFAGSPTVSGSQQASISTTSATHSTLGDNSIQAGWPTNSFSTGNVPITIPSYTLTLGSTTTVYLVASGVFSGGTMTAYGRISAFRIV